MNEVAGSIQEHRTIQTPPQCNHAVRRKERIGIPIGGGPNSDATMIIQLSRIQWIGDKCFSWDNPSNKYIANPTYSCRNDDFEKKDKSKTALYCDN